MKHERPSSPLPSFETVQQRQAHKELFQEFGENLPYAPDPILNVTLNPACNPERAEYDKERTDRAKERQRNLARLFTDLAPKEFPEEVREMIHRDYLAGIAQRNSKSLEGYGRLLERRRCEGDMTQAPYEEDFLWGETTPTETFACAKESGIDSCTVTFVTHFGQRMEHVYEAREAISQAIRDHGGNEFENRPADYTKMSVQPQRNIEAHDQNLLQLDGYLAVYKRNVGEFKNDAGEIYDVIERQALAIDLRSPSADMDEEIYRELHPVRTFHDEQEYTAWFDRVNQHGEEYFANKIRASLEIPDYAHPTSTTIYIAKRNSRGDLPRTRSAEELEESEEIRRRIEAAQAADRAARLATYAMLYVNRSSGEQKDIY